MLTLRRDRVAYISAAAGARAFHEACQDPLRPAAPECEHTFLSPTADIGRIAHFVISPP